MPVPGTLIEHGTAAHVIRSPEWVKKLDEERKVIRDILVGAFERVEAKDGAR